MKRIELRRHGRVLIIDDDPDYLEAMREALSREGHEVVCCEDPRAADAVVASERPDVVLLDRHMSTLSGLEVCVALRKRVENDHLPILLVTNDTSLEAISVAVEAGVNDFVDKAAPFEILRLRVRAALRTRVLSEQAERRVDEQRFLARHAESLGASLDERALLREAARALERFDLSSLCVVLLSDREAPRIASYGVEPLSQDPAKVRELLELAQAELKVNFDPDELVFIHESFDWPRPVGRPFVARLLRGAAPRPRAWLAVELSRPWTDADVALFEGVVQQLAPPLENARLYSNLMNAHDELAETLRKLRQAQSVIAQNERLANIGMLAAGVAHEINNPLAFVISNLNVMREYGRDLGQIVRFHQQGGHRDDFTAPPTMDPDFLLADLEALIQESVEGANRMHGIVRNLRSFAHQSANANEEVEVQSAVESTLNLLNGEMVGRAIVVRQLRTVPAVRGDRGKLNQVFLNLVVNALHAIPEGREGRVVVRLFQDASDVVFEVEDNGTGIPDHALAHIFEPFYTTKENGRGTGLGLTLVDDIVHQHGGRVAVETEPGHGTKFTVRLPARSTVPMPSIVLHPGPPDEPQGVAVFIDDERFLLNAFKRAFSRVARIRVAHGGEEGIRLLQDTPEVDVVFCDLLMPRVNGIEVFEWIRTHRPALIDRFVVLTAGANEERFRTFLENSGVTVVNKPFSVHEVSELILGFTRGAVGGAARTPFPHKE
ncbi:MAG: response regulator [Bradymonadia bacterium]